mgnify:CR=1 FL=1
MARALARARDAAAQGEVPVGAILVGPQGLIAEGWNQPIAHADCSAHAEIVCLRAAGQVVGNYRLPGTTLYVTLEPCVMCAGAIIQARVKRVVFGAADPKAGAAGSVHRILPGEGLNHQVILDAGLMAEASGALLRDFFREKRAAARGAASAV